MYSGQSCVAARLVLRLLFGHAYVAARLVPRLHYGKLHAVSWYRIRYRVNTNNADRASSSFSNSPLSRQTHLAAISPRWSTIITLNRCPAPPRSVQPDIPPRWPTVYLSLLAAPGPSFRRPTCLANSSLGALFLACRSKAATAAAVTAAVAAVAAGSSNGSGGGGSGSGNQQWQQQQLLYAVLSISLGQPAQRALNSRWATLYDGICSSSSSSSSPQGKTDEMASAAAAAAARTVATSHLYSSTKRRKGQAAISAGIRPARGRRVGGRVGCMDCSYAGANRYTTIVIHQHWSEWVAWPLTFW